LMPLAGSERLREVPRPQYPTPRRTPPFFHHLVTPAQVAEELRKTGQDRSGEYPGWYRAGTTWHEWKVEELRGRRPSCLAHDLTNTAPSEPRQNYQTRCDTSRLSGPKWNGPCTPAWCQLNSRLGGARCDSGRYIERR
jgi:hypothetical protein